MGLWTTVLYQLTMLLSMIWMQPTHVKVSTKLEKIISHIIYMYVLDNKINEGVIYDGFYLSNYARNNVYRSVTVEECQYLCEITDQCRYFIYDLKSLMSGGPFKNKCHLKFGVGRQIDLEGGAFGHKYSSGKEHTVFCKKKKNICYTFF